MKRRSGEAAKGRHEGTKAQRHGGTKRQVLRFTACCLLPAACFLSLTGCDHGRQQQMQMPQRPPAAVTVAQAVTKDVPLYLEEIGKTVAVESVAVVPQVGGKIIATHVVDGAYVKKGDLLFEIDPRPFQAALASARATLLQAKAELELAKTEYTRLNSLRDTAAVSQLELDQKKIGLSVADAKIAAADAAVESATLSLEYAKIYAPIDGRAGARLVDPGNVVKANDAPMLVIQRLDPIYAEFTITENDLGTVRKFLAGIGMQAPERGLKALVDVPGDSAKVLTALGGVPASTRPATQQARSFAGAREGELTFLDNSVQTATGTVRLRATLPNADRYFWPGQFVNVRLVLTTRKDAVLVPAQAQQIGQQGPYVYVVKEQAPATQPATTQPAPKVTIAEIRPIKPGQRQGDMLVVDQGLQAGEMVVIAGQLAIMPGGPVMVVNPPKPGGPAAGPVADVK